MTGYAYTKQGRYKCEFCNHPSYKTYAGINAHIESNHALDLEKTKNEALRMELKKEREKPAKVEYRDAPKPKTWTASVYCAACQVVIQNAGIPRGQTIQQTPHSTCGTLSLNHVREIQL